MGRLVVGESFLRAFLAYSTAGEFWAQVTEPEHARRFSETVKASGRPEAVQVVDSNDLTPLSRPGVVYLPGPGIGKHAFHRAAYGHGAWSLCGVTHTTATANAMDTLAELITAPAQPWDALICTSAAVKDNVVRVLQAQMEHLRDRLGAAKFPLPQLPVIPLGIHTQDFSYAPDERGAARKTLNVEDDGLVVLFVGRLTFHAKAHPLAMYQALEKAAGVTGKRVTLIECGWPPNQHVEKAYADAARLACPSARVITLDGLDAAARRTAWAGADVFCSLADNIQETFGITPIEAMAAGLPVVVSDWDGYKDTVRDGVDGFRIPTVAPASGLGKDLALRHALEIDNYDRYCGYACLLAAVDVQATAQAFARLFASPKLREEMGAAGRRRARETYDWSAIIPQYEALWDHLNEIRRAEAKDLTPLLHPWPARMDPFYAFASYPTRSLTPDTVLRLVDADATLAFKRTLAYRKLAMIDFAAAILPNHDEILTVLVAAAAGPRSAGELVAGIGAGRRPLVLRALVCLMKLGVLSLDDEHGR
jgi:glycosyltransferase involved in cell wall biosynthesis